jgi:hypothetical protein
VGRSLAALNPKTKHGGAPGKAGGGKVPLPKVADSATFVAPSFRS